MLIKNMVSLTKQEIKSCKHSKENKLFFLGALWTILLLLGIFLGSFFRTEIITEMKQELIKEYKIENTVTDSVTDEEILLLVSEEDQEILSHLEFYYWPVVLLIPLAFFLFILYMTGKMYGGVRGNSVKLNKNQYPEVHKIFVEMAQNLNFEEIPELYLVNGNGTLNAYATCVPGSRNFAAIYSDILERCLKNGDMESLKFILGHELGHIKYNHVKWWYNFFTLWMNFPGMNYLFWLPLSRSREYGCDKLAEKLSGDSSGKGLMMLGAGKYAYQDIDLNEYLKEHFEKSSFWASVANLHQRHGIISWRIAAICKKHQAGLIFRNKK